MNDFHYYKPLSFDELIEDAEFKRWVFNPTTINERYWKEFLEAYPDQIPKIEEAKAFLQATKEFFEVIDDSLAGFEPDQIYAGELKPGRAIKLKKEKYQNIWLRWTVAASLFLLIGSSVWYFNSHEDRPLKYLTNFGEWEEVELPDGSKVNLNANSQMVLSSDWENDSDRKVWLEGEAFFDVQSIPATGSKFQVMTGGLTIEVLGTQFNVQNRGSHTEIFLKEGKIKLDVGGKIEYMSPGQFIHYSDEKKAIISRHSLPQESYTSWKDGTLQMNSSTEEFLNAITEIYGVEIEVTDSNVLVEERNFAVPLEQLETVIPIIETTLGKQIIKDGNKLVIK